MESELVKLIKCIELSEVTEEAIKNGISFLKTVKSSRNRLESCHNALCVAMLTSYKAWSQAANDLLYYCGTQQVLSVVYNNIPQAELVTVQWLTIVLTSQGLRIIITLL